MRKRISDEVLLELINNGGCRKGSVEPINATGITRLALDLEDARAEVATLKRALTKAEPSLDIE